MAIKIPSKNIYEKKNAKVRDNVIERIEIGAVEIVPNNEFKTSIYNERQQIITYYGADVANSNFAEYNKLPQDATDEDAFYAISAVLVGIRPIYCNISVKIPKIKENRFVSKVLNLEANLTCKKIITFKGGTFDQKTSTYIENSSQIENTFLLNNVSIYEILSKKDENGETPKDYKGYLVVEGREDYLDYSDYIVAEAKAKDESDDLSKIKYSSEDSDYYYFDNIKILCGAETVVLSGSDKEENSPIQVWGNAIQYIPVELEITAYGNTIGIDLQDKVVYIPDGDKTSKKVISFEGNELMQTTNHTEGNANDFISTQFALTKESYAKGKETATILCSINDYYDFETGELKISAKGEILKMCFDEHDQVIPMVFGADGNDYPMSLNADGTPKVFTVLGTKIFYDGAVWQELYLQET